MGILKKTTLEFALTLYGVWFMWVRDIVYRRKTCEDCGVQGQVYWNEFNEVIQCHACGFQPWRRKLP